MWPLLNAQLAATILDDAVLVVQEPTNACRPYLQLANVSDEVVPRARLEQACPQLFEKGTRGLLGSMPKGGIKHWPRVVSNTSWWDSPARASQSGNGRMWTLTTDGDVPRPMMQYALSNPTLPPTILARLNGRLQRGTLRAYGQAFDAVLRFTPSVTRAADAALEPARHAALLIGMHVRHPRGGPELDATHYDNLTATELAFVAAARTAVDESAWSNVDTSNVRPRSCYVFIASDRAESIVRMAAALAGACQVLSTSHDETHQRKSFRAEHGLYTGMTFMVELAALGRCPLVFLSPGSSSSELIGSLALRTRGHRAFVMVFEITHVNATKQRQEKFIEVTNAQQLDAVSVWHGTPYEQAYR